MIIGGNEIGWSTIPYGLLVGYSVDFYNNLLIQLDVIKMSFIIRFICIVIGQVLVVVTFAFLIKYQSGMHQLDAIAIGLERIYNVPYKVIRTLFDVLFLGIGWLLGGVVGIGTLLSMITTGCGINVCLKIMDK